MDQMEDDERAVEMQLICMRIRDEFKARIAKFDGDADSWPDLRHPEVSCKSSLPGPLWDEDLCPLVVRKSRLCKVVFQMLVLEIKVDIEVYLDQRLVQHAGQRVRKWGYPWMIIWIPSYQ